MSCSPAPTSAPGAQSMSRGLRILGRPAHRVVHTVPAAACLTGHPRRRQEEDRGNRDISAPAMIDAALSYPDVVANSVTGGARRRGHGHPGSPIARPPSGRSIILELASTSRADASLGQRRPSAEDRATLAERYPFLEFGPGVPEDGPATYSRRSAPRSADDSGSIWTTTGGFSRPIISSAACPRCWRPNQPCSRSRSITVTRRRLRARTPGERCAGHLALAATSSPGMSRTALDVRDRATDRLEPTVQTQTRVNAGRFRAADRQLTRCSIAGD